MLSINPLEFLLDLISTDLSISHGGLIDWDSLLRHLSQVISYLFQHPDSFSSAVGEIMVQDMEREIINLLPLVFVSLLFEGAQPVINASFRTRWFRWGQRRRWGSPSKCPGINDKAPLRCTDRPFSLFS
jgi:hypothetical protein